MNSDISSLAAIAQGFIRGRQRLEELRREEIRRSNIKGQVASFDGLFEHAIANGVERAVTPLSKAMRVLIGVDR